MAKKKRLLIIDSNSLVHRAFHALPPMSTPKGEMVNAVYGFMLAFFKAINEFQPDYIAATFDHHAPTNREKKFKEYKAKRKKAPDELYGQIPKIKEILIAFHVPVFEKAGFEADDIIGTIAKLAPQRQAVPPLETIILSGDMDLLQLVDKQTKVQAMRKGIKDSVLFDKKKVQERFGVGPELVADWKGLRGDPSDNIPGVAGVGEKTATHLLFLLGSLESVYSALKAKEDIPGVSPKLRETLLKEKDIAFLSKELATIDREVPIDFSLPDLLWQGFSTKEVEKVLLNFGFRTLASRIPEIGEKKENQEVSKEDELTQKLKHLYEEGVLSEEVYEMEQELTPVLRMMEETGILIDKKFFKKLSGELAKNLQKLEVGIIKKAGITFNINSPKQLSEVLFEKMGLSSRGLHKTPGGVISTASGELEKLKDASPIASEVLKYRELAKLQNTYVTPLPRLADKEGRVHTSFDQLGAATGRLSSANPNLQNIPLQGNWGKKIRCGFVSKKGFSLVSFDYSQVELRIASHIAGEEKMQEVFLQGRDIHQETAAVVFGVKDMEVTEEMRFRAKALNFGILYGMGARGFSQSAGISYQEAEDFIENYFAKFPHIARYMQDTIESTRELGYAQTLFGRKRYLPDIQSSTPHIRAAAERVAINHPIQGFQADIIKMAMVRIAKELKLQQEDCRMLLQIHDELLFEIRDDIVEKRAKDIASLMEKVVVLKVPLIVTIKAGKNWGVQKSIL
ncbi:MAG: DNA polymerase [bacterium]|nr:DNA polymerase [bacterium]